MAGEEEVRIEHVQPGDRPPAPGELGLLQAFLNTHYDLTAEHGGELLTAPGVLQRWLAARALIDAGAELHEHDLQRALTVREGLRALAFTHNGQALDQPAVAALRQAAAPATLHVHLHADGPRFAPGPGAPLDGAVGALLAIITRATLEDTWPRLKACPGRNCGWVFFDHSRNQSARWCAMKVCGDREKARAYYERHRDDRARGE